MADTDGRKPAESKGTGKVRRRGEGLGTGPVGGNARSEGTHASGGPTGRPSGTRPSSGSGRRNQGGNDRGILSDLVSGVTGSSSSGSSSSKKSGLNIKTILIVVVIIALLGGGGTKLLSCLGQQQESTNNGGILSSLVGSQTSNLGSVLGNLGLSSLLGGSGSGSLLSGSAFSSLSSSSGSWLGKNNTGTLNTKVSSGVRDKYTKIPSGKKATNTIMVYMCGSDLETKYGMATKDLAEMTKASYGDNVRILVYTGGCAGWQSSDSKIQNNRIYEVKDGGLKTVVKDTKKTNILSPDTLTYFIKYCKDNYKADRYDLILWDHGGGSVAGYGYDDTRASSSSMTLAQLASALKNAGVKFDFVGFDACLMATAETALMLEPYADYLIASEESEPGIGWYYTNWLTSLGSNPSLSTIELGKIICDDFVSQCASSCPGQSTTLSVIDVAEFAAKVPEKLTDFAKETTKLITDQQYETVAKARGLTREFARSSKIDQVDLVHFALNLGTTDSKELADALLSAIKYNKTSSDMANSYGVSIFFPYSSSRNVDSAIKTYDAIGMDNAYSKCIKEFATMEVAGQVTTGGTNESSYASSLLGLLGGGGNSGQSASTDLFSSLLSGALGNTGTSSSSGLGNVVSLISGLTSGRNVDFLADRALTNEEMAEYLAGHMIDVNKLNWKAGEATGSRYISLTKEEWALVTDLQLSLYYDDGAGYIDLGMDNVFSFDDYGNLLAPEKLTWLGYGEEFVAYYFDEITADKKIRGHIPALVNGELSEIVVVFDAAHPEGTAVGFLPKNDDTETVAKISELADGMKVVFIADCYDYDGTYDDTFRISDEITVNGTMHFVTLDVADGSANAMYRLTDIYGQKYWTNVIPY